MEISQRFGIIEPDAFGHKAFDELQHAVRAVYETGEYFLGIRAD